MSEAVLDSQTAGETGTPWYRNKKLDQWICFWTIPVFYGLFGLVFVLFARIMPPPRPGAPIEDIVAFMQSPGLLVATVILLLSLGLASVSAALVVTQMKRMEGVSPALRYAYLGALAIGGIPGCLFPMLTFAAAAFRPEYDPQLLALFYDIGFLAFVGSLGCFCTQYLVFIIAIFLDKRRIFPKWLAYISIWAYVTEIVAAPVWITQVGAFAWNGLLAFWLGTIIFVAWQFLVVVCLYWAIKNDPGEEPSLA
jgi:hypothetical protein